MHGLTNTIHDYLETTTHTQFSLLIQKDTEGFIGNPVQLNFIPFEIDIYYTPLLDATIITCEI